VSRPTGMAVDKSTHTAYVAGSIGSGGDGTLTVIDTTTGKVTGTIAVGKWPGNVAIDEITHSAYLISTVSPWWVSVIDTKTRTVAATITIGASAEGVAVDATAHAAYVVRHDGTVSVMDTRTRTITATITTGGKVFGGIAVDERRHRAYISMSVDLATVVMIDTLTNKVTGTIPAGFAPGGLSVDPTTGTLYVVDNDHGLVLVLRPR
jgi:YVTN family beta-propeller protein